ncbi:hypothetical protein QQF64_025931, partial [Cirrhinus molitorella]
SSGVDDDHVFISSGENVRLPCNNALHDCKTTTWNYNRLSATVELIALGIKKKNTESHERLSLGSHCSLNIKNITKEDYGLYTCRQYVNRQQQRADAHVYLHVLHVSSSSSQTEISAGSSVSLSCQLYSSYGVSCDDWIRHQRINLFWVNQTGDKLKILDSRYQISAPRHCIITLTTTLLNENDNREWRCEVTQGDQVKTSVTYTVKIAGDDTFELHSVQMELEAVEKQIRQLLERQAELRAALESSQVSIQRDTNTPTTSTPCASLCRPSAPRTRSSQMSFTPALGHHGPWVQQQRKTRARPRTMTSPPPPPLVFEISTRNRFAPLRETERDAVIVGDSIV